MAFLAGFPLFGGPTLAGARRPRNFRFRGEMADTIDEELEKKDIALAKIQLSLLPT